jgi:TPP-dependent indolepyruvate ferredoxin oxidoreductase alpha subunit
MTYDRRKADYPPHDRENESESQRRKTTTPGTSICVSQLAHARRFCEGCREYKAKNASLFVKGWRCTDCQLKET